MKHFTKITFWIACCVVALLSLIPGEYFPSALNWQDKIQHLLVFLVLGSLGFFAYREKYCNVVWGLLIYGALIELAQVTTGWRYGDLQDWIADAIGVMISYLLFVLWRYPRFHNFN